MKQVLPMFLKPGGAPGPTDLSVPVVLEVLTNEELVNDDYPAGAI